MNDVVKLFDKYKLEIYIFSDDDDLYKNIGNYMRDIIKIQTLIEDPNSDGNYWIDYYSKIYEIEHTYINLVLKIIVNIFTNKIPILDTHRCFLESIIPSDEIVSNFKCIFTAKHIRCAKWFIYLMSDVKNLSYKYNKINDIFNTNNINQIEELIKHPFVEFLYRSAFIIEKY